MEICWGSDVKNGHSCLIFVSFNYSIYVLVVLRLREGKKLTSSLYFVYSELGWRRSMLFFSHQNHERSFRQPNPKF